jgi:hypothetical protein
MRYNINDYVPVKKISFAYCDKIKGICKPIRYKSNGPFDIETTFSEFQKHIE